MIRSMTGYGRHQAVIDGLDITVEIKSVNHRYFEFSARTPRGYSFIEDKLKSYVQSRMARGKVDVYVTISAVEDTASEVIVNMPLAQSYYNGLRALVDELHVRDDISATTIARMPDVFTVHKAVADEEKITKDILSVTEQAVDRFIEMRQTEGARLRDDVLSRAATILSLVERVEERVPQTLAEYTERLRTRIAELIGDVKLDEQRLITEIAIFADKIAVDEETVRLRSHLKQLDDMLSADEPVGRKLDFLVQEMNREANTIGSKSQDTQLAHIVVDIKAEIEKIREQIQNME